MLSLASASLSLPRQVPRQRLRRRVRHLRLPRRRLRAPCTSSAPSAARTAGAKRRSRLRKRRRAHQPQPQPIRAVRAQATLSVFTRRTQMMCIIRTRTESAGHRMSRGHIRSATHSLRALPLQRLQQRPLQVQQWRRRLRRRAQHLFQRMRRLRRRVLRRLRVVFTPPAARTPSVGQIYNSAGMIVSTTSKTGGARPASLTTRPMLATARRKTVADAARRRMLRLFRPRWTRRKRRRAALPSSRPLRRLHRQH